ncbi:MAG: ELM1/GtrOC1 family putative glycosyltransferase, partial [Candidatus Omnitrophica bacterium]|nr:ELM1/GtrOC1 family putative glycosyltransferase [Candidatus Omnitrophota bacterium]
EVISQIKAIAGGSGMGILATTSRRTPVEIEELVKNELRGYPACKFLVIANEKNIPEAVGGILGLSKVVVVSPESISMISEAASAGCQVIVFESKLDPRHAGFLKEMALNKYIRLSRASGISKVYGEMLKNGAEARLLKDNVIIKEALKKVL